MRKAVKTQVGRLLTITVPVPLWIAIFVGSVIIIALYFAAPTYRDHLKFVTAILAGAAALYSAYYIGASLRMGIERDKKNKSFDILGLLNRPEFVEVRSFIETELKEHHELSPNALYDKIMGDERLLNAVTIVLGILEDTSIAIQNDYVDEDIIYQSLSLIVPWNYTYLRPFIEHLREIRGDDRLYKELEKLKNAWASLNRLCDNCSLPADI